MHEECRYAVHVRKSMFILQKPQADLRGNSNPSEKKCATRDVFIPVSLTRNWRGYPIDTFQQKVCSFNKYTQWYQEHTNIQSWHIFLHWYWGEPRSTPSCRNWTGAVGSCRFGAACHFRHEELTPELRSSLGFRLSYWDLDVPRCSYDFVCVEGWRIWSELLKQMKTAEGYHTQNQKQRQLYSLKHAEVKHEQGRASNSIKAPEKSCR